MTRTGTTILLGVPTMLTTLCQAARSAPELPPVRIAHVGGAAVPVEVARDFERTFGGEVHEGYGLTELSGIATSYLQGQPRKPGSVGMPLGGTELRILSLAGGPLPAGEIGDVQLRGPSVIPATGRIPTRAPPRSPPTAGSRPATWATSTRTATSSSSTAARS